MGWRLYLVRQRPKECKQNAMYTIATQHEILLQTFGKYEACGYWEALQQHGGIEATLFFQGEAIDYYDPLDLTIETVFDPPVDLFNWDDCEFEMLF